MSFAKELGLTTNNTGRTFEGFRVSPTESTEKILFRGFSPDQETWLKGQLEKTGLPLVNVREVSYRPNQLGRENVVGTANWLTGELTLLKSLEKLPEIVHLGTIAHELAHLNSPFIENNKIVFGGQEKQEKAARHAETIAVQTLQTGKFLNGYHKYLFGQLAEGEIDFASFAEETHAIMVELRFTNPKHLLQVEEAQRKSLVKKGMSNKFTSIVDGVDNTLMSLMWNVLDREHLDQYITSFRKSFRTAL